MGGLLVLVRAGALNARLDSGQELCALLAVAGEVRERGASVAGQGRDEAGQLWCVSERFARERPCDMPCDIRTYSTGWDVVELSRGDGGQGNDGRNGEGLHGDGDM